MNGVWGVIPQGRMYAGGMLKSTQERLERRQACDRQVAFYEERISLLKDVKCVSLDEIDRKLELLHSYQDYIAAAKHEYNHQQMFHVMDEAEERGEQIAEASEKDEEEKAAEKRREGEALEAQKDECNAK